jgi:hypothetical protein
MSTGAAQGDGLEMTESGRELRLHFTVAEIRVILAALNTVLSRPTLFRPSVLETAESIATRLVSSLQSTRVATEDADLADTTSASRVER